MVKFWDYGRGSNMLSSMLVTLRVDRCVGPCCVCESRLMNEPRASCEEEMKKYIGENYILYFMRVTQGVICNPRRAYMRETCISATSWSCLDAIPRLWIAVLCSRLFSATEVSPNSPIFPYTSVPKGAVAGMPRFATPLTLSFGYCCRYLCCIDQAPLSRRRTRPPPSRAPATMWSP